MINFTDEQRRAYERYIRARNNVSLGQYRRHNKSKWQPTADVVCTVDIAGMNHPLFEQNDEWIEYKEASLAWWAIEPQFRKDERMSMIRGDYGSSDSWREKQTQVKEI
jgi:hypothetical protein